MEIAASYQHRNTIFQENYPESFFKIKHLNIIGQFSSLALVMHKDTMEHATFQSVRTTNKENIIRQVMSKQFAESEFVLQFLQEVMSKEDSPITWLVYESCLCSINDYISIAKYRNISPGVFFASDDNGGRLAEILTEDSDKYLFKVKVVAMQFIYQLFSMVEFLNQINFNNLFFLSNILITTFGKLKLFPGHEDYSKSSKNKDPEDIAQEILESEVNVGIFTELLKTVEIVQIDNLDYLRNLFAAGLISVRLLFRDWSPFRIDDLEADEWRDFNLNWSIHEGINQNMWMVRCVFDPLVRDEYIVKGLTKASNEDKMIQELVGCLIDIFHPRGNRKSGDILMKLSVQNCNYIQDLERLSEFLQNYYSSLLAENQHAESSINANNKKRKHRKRKESSDNLSEGNCHNLDDACATENSESLEGLSNWVTDGSSFRKLGARPSSPVAECPLKRKQGCSSCSINVPEIPSVDNDENDTKSTILNFEMSENVTGCGSSLDKVFPIFKTLKNDIYLEFMSKKAKSVKLALNNAPKPVIVCHPDGFCNLHYDFDSHLGMYLNQVPLKFITEDIETSNCSCNVPDLTECFPDYDSEFENRELDELLNDSLSD